METAKLEKIGEHVFELSSDYRHDMRVPVRIVADGELLESIAADDSIEQLVNVSTLPGVHRHVIGMPDMHLGYGFPVGGVAATRLPDGVISPGGIGFDINCGVRLLTTGVTFSEIQEVLEPLVHQCMRTIPSGYGRRGRLELGRAELDAVLEDGVSRLVEDRGMGNPEDVPFIESEGALEGADAALVSERAKERGRDQLGTLGGGNHFLEIQVVGEILDTEAAETLRLREGDVTVLIHTGSRGLGHQVCTDYLRRFESNGADFGFDLPDRQLAAAPLSSDLGSAYFGAMCAAANFAFSNRQVLTHRLREIFDREVGHLASPRLRVVYDVAHNIAKREEYDGVEVCVHRKGATRSFGPAEPDIPAAYRSIGQPVFIPGSMGTSSFVLAGMDDSREVSFGSTCHGAGRRMSRSAVKKEVSGAQLRRELESKGIVVRCPSNAELAEEAPRAYKDVDQVVAVVERAGIARRVARLRPVGVLKG